MTTSATTPGTVSTYASHPLHGDDRTWPETNCYVDLWIEVLHARGLEPLAGLAFTLGLDYEGDQFTFFKFPHADLRVLFGIEVQELNVWRPLEVHAAEQLALGRMLMPETFPASELEMLVTGDFASSFPCTADTDAVEEVFFCVP